MPRFDAVLFDVDGTIIHSRPGILHTFSYTLKQLGVDPDTVDLNRYLGPPLRWSFSQHFSQEADVEKAVTVYREYYARTGMHECTVFDGVREMLQTLHEAGIFLATATSKPTQVVKPILEEQGLSGFFDLIGGASMDKSVDTKTAVIAQNLKDSRLQGKQILMVGDRRDDMQGAADCGLAAAGVLYGYGSREELTAYDPVMLAASPAELTSMILLQPTREGVTNL